MEALEEDSSSLLQVRVRPATLNDRSTVIKILRESFTGSYRYWAIRGMDETLVLVAEVNGRIAGVAEVYTTRVGGYGKVGVVYFLAVRKEYRGMGIGKKLVLEAEELFRREKCTYSAASTVESNRASQGLFRSLGYSLFRKGSRVYWDLVEALSAYEDDVVMVKKL